MKNLFRKFTVIFSVVLSFSLVFTGCEAERNNSTDPGNPDNAGMLLQILQLLGGGGGGGGSNWSSPVQISDDPSTCQKPKVVLDSNGRAIATWLETGPPPRLFAKVDDGTKAWGTKVQLSEPTSQDVRSYEIDMKSDGEAFVIFSQNDAGADDIYTKQYNNGWQNNSLRHALAGGDTATFSDIVINETGNVACVYSTTTSSNYAVFYDGAWEAFENLYGGGAGNGVVSVAMDDNTDAVTVSLNAGGEVYANRWDGIDDWTAFYAPKEVSFAGDTCASSQIALNANGKGCVIWLKTNGTKIVQAKTLDLSGAWNTTAWSSIVDLSTGGSTFSSPRIGVESTGKLITIWAQDSQVYARTYNGSSWDTAEQISSGSSAGNPDLVVDNSGNAVVVWIQDNHVFTCVYNSGVGWEVPVQVSTGDDSASMPDVAMNGTGEAIAVWIQDGKVLTSTSESPIFSK